MDVGITTPLVELQAVIINIPNKLLNTRFNVFFISCHQPLKYYSSNSITQ
jgi:hypothetical protein